MRLRARLGVALLILGLAAWFLGTAAWLDRMRAPFRLALEGRADGWSLAATALRARGADLSLELALAREPHLPPSFAWELALPGQSVACRGVAALPWPPPREVGLAPCEGRWLGDARSLARQAGAFWFAVTWWDGARLREVRFALRAASSAAPDGSRP